MARGKPTYSLGKKKFATGVLEWTNVANGKKDGFEEMRDWLYDEQFQQCVVYGRTKLDDARNAADYTDRTGNLADSYMFGVYFNGKLEYSEWQRQKQATKARVKNGDTYSGHEEAQAYLNSYNSRIAKGWEVVWVAAMYYAGYLDQGTSRHKSFYVISVIRDDVSSAFGSANVKVEYV